MGDLSDGQLAIVVVNFGSHELIESNFAHGAEPLSDVGEVYVVDDFSTEAERTAITDVCTRHGFTLILRSNRGFAAGCNAGVQMATAAGARAILLVNPDARVSSSVGAGLAAQVLADPDLMVSPRMVTSSATPYFHGIRLDLRSGRMRSRPRWSPDSPAVLELDSPWPNRDWLTAACLVVHVDLWRRVGGMDESYFLYWEDVDFSQRCVAAGG